MKTLKPCLKNVMSNWYLQEIRICQADAEGITNMYNVPEGWKEVGYLSVQIVSNDRSRLCEIIKNINEEGRKVKLFVVSVGISDKVYALKVKLSPEVVSVSKYSYILLSYSEGSNYNNIKDIKNWCPLNPYSIYGCIKTISDEQVC